MGFRPSGLRALLALTLALGLWSPLARADEPDAGTRVAARELAVSGAEAFDKQDYATALDRFQRAEALYKVPSIAVMVARCLSRTGNLVEAVDKYEETLRMPLDPAAPEAFQRGVADAAAEVELVRARVARLELRLPAEVPAGLEVLLDARVVPAALLGVPKPVNPGMHHVTAHAPGRASYSYDLTLTEGAKRTIDISLPELVRAAPPPAAIPHATASRGPSVLSISLLAGGGVSLAAGTITGVIAMNRKQELDDACSPGCPSDMAGELKSYRRYRAASYTAFGLGIAATGVGAYLLFHESRSGGQVGALLLPGGAGLAGKF